MLHCAMPALSQTAPVITSQPQSSTNLTATDVLFTVEATGTAPLRYQWYFNGTIPMPGETGSSLLLTNLAVFQEAIYTVVITNVAGAVTSAPAVLEIIVPPLVVRQPTNQIVQVGGTATFDFLAVGDEPITYQWFYNVIVEIVGATNTILVLTNVQPSDSGTYQAEATNIGDTVNTVEAVLLVKHPVVITAHPTNLAMPPGGAATFSVDVSGDGPFRYQWFFNGTNSIFAATNASYSIASAALHNSGTYTVRITGDVNSVTSDPASLLVLQAPVFAQQPANMTALAGGTATFSVGVIGTAPLSYQWFFNRTNALTDATNSMLTISNLVAQNAGVYSVFVSNQVGSLFSGNATLNVIVPPVITSQPSDVAVPLGQQAVFTVQATGSEPLVYRWYFNGTNPIFGATGPTLAFSRAQFTNVGSYTVSITNLAGAVTSAPVQLVIQSPPVLVQQPVNRSTLLGGSATFSVVVQGEAPLEYQWLFNATNSILDATNAVLSLTNIQPADVGRYSVRISNRLGIVSSVEAILTIKQPPTITEQPASLTVTQGNSAIFTVAVSGDGPFGYRWLFNGTNAVPGNNGPSLSRANATAANAGTYSVIVTNDVGSVASADAVLIVRLLPTITQQPGSLILPTGGTASFGVSVSGDEPFSYQWRYNATNNLVDATNATLVLTNIQLVQIGNYSVVVMNPVGTATSDEAMLSIQVPPSIAQQPSSLIVTQGQSGSFNVVAQGDGPFAYQWFLNESSLILNATNSTLDLIDVQPAAEGDYSVLVTNLVGSVVSAPASLTVRPLPVIVQQPVSLVVTQGQSATFSVTADSSTPLTYLWRHNGAELPVTTASLELADVQSADSGDYDVIVGNDHGAVTSVVATLTVFELDFGDAPEPGYATRLADDAARHVIVPGVFLGDLVDAEQDGQPDSTATGDDISGAIDEDGVRFLAALRIGQVATIEVIASTNGLLSAWMDFNQTNGWLDVDEQILANEPLSPGTNLVSFTIPRDAIIGESFARFRFSTAPDLQVTGLAPDGEVEDYRVDIQSASDLELVQFASPSIAIAGSNVIFTVLATNIGPSTASNVIVTTRLSTRSIFNTAIASAGSCVFSNGIVTCEIEALASGEGLSIEVEAAIGMGTNTAFASVSSAQYDPASENNSASTYAIGTGITPQYANSDILILPVPDPGVATPYPANVIVSGINDAVYKVLVTLRNVNHGFPDDMDVLLVGPGGQHCMLISDAGFDVPMVDATLTFDEDSFDILPDGAAAIPSGIYRPVDYPPDSDSFPAPAPAGPYSADPGVFRGTDPNGVWSLYVVDDSVDNGVSGDPGFIADGWTLTIITAEPLADLGIEIAAQPSTVSIGEPISYTITVTNHGPTASSAVVRDILPAELNFVSANIAPGECIHEAGIVTCDLGELDAGATVTFTIDVVPTIGGDLTNAVSVSGNQLDLNGINDSSSVVSVVHPAANLGVALSGPQQSVLLLKPFDSVVTISNEGPNLATGVWLTNQLPVGATFISAVTSQGACVGSDGLVICEVGDVPVGADVSLQIRMTAGVLGGNSNRVEVVAAEQDFVSENNTASHLFDVDPAVDLVVTSSGLPASPAAGGEYALFLTVSNGGPLTVDAVLVDELPSTVTFLSASPTRGNCTNDNGQVQCQFDQMLPGESVVVVVNSRTTLIGSITNIAVVTGSIADYNPDYNVTTNIVTVISSANLALNLIAHPNPVWLGDNLTYALTVTNLGLNSATDVQVTNMIPNGVSFISAASSVGACIRIGNEVRCSIGVLAPGSGAVISVVTRPTQIGLITSTAVASATEFDPETANNQATLTTRVITGSSIFANSARITTPVLGISTPYPTSVNVSGVPGTIFALRVTLNNFSHTYPDDLDILLVGPGGRTVLLMSDAGGELPMNATTLTFDDSAPSALPDLSGITSGQFRPTNYGTDTDSFAAPAPLGPYGTNLAVFNDTNPNGVWSLYIVDDADKDFGILANGWSLAISTISAPVISAIADVVINEDTATGAIPFTVQDFDTPAETIALSYTSSNPALVPVSNVVFSGTGVNRSLNITPLPNLSGTTLIRLIATDITGASSTNQFTITVNPVIDEIQIQTQPQGQFVLVAATVNFSVSGASTLPLTYQWQRDTVDLPGEVLPTLTLSNVQLTNAGAYRVLVSNADTSVFSSDAILRVTDEFPSPNIVSISRADQTATVAFTTTVGVTYTLEFKNTFDDVDWSPLGSLPGTGNTESIIDPVADVPTRFYRIRVN